MKKSTFLIIPVAFAVGAVVAYFYGDDIKEVVKRESDKLDPARITEADPVYLRETQTSGHGL